jgi:hypothetical protein
MSLLQCNNFLLIWAVIPLDSPTDLECLLSSENQFPSYGTINTSTTIITAATW